MLIVTVGAGTANPPQRRFLLILAALFVLTGCGERQAENDGLSLSEFGHDGLRPTRVHGELLGGDPVVGKPGRVLNVGGSLWVLDFARDPFMHVFRSADGSLARSLARSGQGPGELTEPLNLSGRSGDTSGVWAFDPMQRRVTRFDAVSDSGRKTVTIRLDVTEMVERAYWADAGTIVGVTGSDTARFILFDTAGQVIERRAGPLLGGDTIPLAERARSTRAMDLCARPSGDGFAITYVGASRVDLFDGAARHRRAAKVPFAGEPVFLRDEATGRIRPSHPIAWYLSCAANDRYVYALFAGYRQEPGAPPPESCVGTFVHVFDWTGELVRVLALDVPVDAITVNGAGDKLAGVCVPSASVVSFAVPSR